MAKLEEMLSQEQIEALKADGYFIEKGEFIPMSRFNEVNSRMKDAESRVTERDAQIDTLSKQKDKGELEAELAKIKAANEQQAADNEARILQIQKDSLIDTELIKEGARDIAALRATLDLTKTTYKDGKLTGLKELIDESKKEKEFLWKQNPPIKAGIEIKSDGKDPFAEFRKL